MTVAYVSLWGVSESLHSTLHSNLDSARETLRSSIVSLLVFCGIVWPYVLPPLFTIALEAPLSQRTWIAVQKTPIPLRSDATEHNTYLQDILRKFRKYSLTHIVPVYLLFVSLLGAFLKCEVYVSAEKMRIFEGVVFGPPFVFTTSRLFGLLSGMYALSVRRGADGDPYIIRTLRPSLPRFLMILPVLLGLLVSLGAIHRDNRICDAIVHTAMLHALVAADVRSTKSMRAVGIYAATNIATLLALAVFLAVHSRNIRLLFDSSSEASYRAGEELNHTRLDQPNELYNAHDADDPRDYRWPLFALSVLWNIFPVELITLCYRFDFARFAPHQDFEFVFESVDGSTDGLDSTKSHCGPSLTHDMLLGPATLQETTAGVGPIYLDPEAPDAFYNYPSPLSSSSTCSTSPLLSKSTDTSKTASEGTPLPSSLSSAKPVIFPAFLTSLTAYISSTLILLTIFYLSVKGRGGVAVKYMAPLLPLATLPLTTIAVPACFSFTGDSEGGIAHLWRYVEVWGSETEQGDEDSELEGRDADSRGVDEGIDNNLKGEKSFLLLA